MNHERISDTREVILANIYGWGGGK